MDIESFRKLCLSFPHTEEDIKWEQDLCMCVGKKMYAVTGLERTDFAASFKVLMEEFDELIDRPGIIPAPYLARYKWVLVQQDDSLTDKEWKHFLRQSYDLVKSKLSKRVLENLGM